MQSDTHTERTALLPEVEHKPLTFWLVVWAVILGDLIAALIGFGWSYISTPH